jgi:hypothetical protein
MATPKGRAITVEDKKFVVQRLLQAWEQTPGLRFGQLLMNACKEYGVKDIYYIEDEILVEIVLGFVSKYSNV